MKLARSRFLRASAAYLFLFAMVTTAVPAWAQLPCYYGEH